MDHFEIVATLVGQLATRSPSLLVYAIGLVLALSFWRRYPRPCLLVSIAMGLALFAMIGSIFLFTYLPPAMLDLGWDIRQLGLVFTIFGLVTNVIHAGAMALLLGAVFVGRQLAPPRWSPEDDGPLPQPASSDTRIQG